MPLDFFFRIKKCPGPVGFGIILELKCVSGYKGFGRTYKTGQSIFIVFYKSCVHCIRSVAGHYKQNRNRVSVAAGIFNIVCETLENQPFATPSVLSSYLPGILHSAGQFLFYRLCTADSQFPCRHRHSTWSNRFRNQEHRQRFFLVLPLLCLLSKYFSLTACPLICIISLSE